MLAKSSGKAPGFSQASHVLFTSFSWAFRQRQKAHDKLARSPREACEKPRAFQELLASFSPASRELPTNEDLDFRTWTPPLDLRGGLGWMGFNFILHRNAVARSLQLYDRSDG
jgi:hypothetical protein